MNSQLKKTITTLPDLCLLTIFDSVPLVDIGSNVLLTCRQWYSFRRSILARRTWLKLDLLKQKTESKSRPESSDTLVWRVFTPERLKWLVTSLVNVHHLTVYFAINSVRYDHPDQVRYSMASVTMLLQLWSDQLYGLEWSFDVKYLHLNPFYVEQLLRAITGLSALRHLNLNYYLLQTFWKTNKAQDGSCSLPMLAKLECLRTKLEDVDLVDFCRWIGSNLRGRGNDHQDLEIVLDDIYRQIYPEYQQPQHQLEQIYASGAPLARFTGAFPEPTGFDSFAQWDGFFAHFTGLTEFRFYDEHHTNCRLSLSELSRLLSRLPSLNQLWVSTDQFDGAINEGEAATDDDVYTPLPSVRVLYIYLHELPDPRYWASLPHSTVFPGLGLLVLQMFEPEDEFDALFAELEQFDEAAEAELEGGQQQQQDSHQPQQGGGCCRLREHYAPPYLHCEDLNEIILLNRRYDVESFYK